MDGEWTINIPDLNDASNAFFGGLVPSYFLNSYATYGNKNQFNALTNVDLFDSNVLTAGVGQAALTNGTQAGAVTTLIAAILRMAVSSDTTYACGGAKYYELSSTTVTNTGGTYPHTIDKAGVTGEDAKGIVYHKSVVYVFYGHSSSAGDIMKDTSGTIDDDWGSTTPTGAGTLQDATLYPAINGGDDDAYFGNGRYIGAIRSNGDLDLTALDFWTDSEVSSLTWNLNRVMVAVNRPNISGANFNQSGVYTWNGIAPSWEGDPVEINGRIGALYTKNGITFMWWQDGGRSAYYNMGYLSGGRAEVLKQVYGTMPNHYQVGEYGGYICWLDGTNGDLYFYGANDSETPVRMFPYTRATYASIGAFSSPFGLPLISSYSSTNYRLTKPSGFASTSSFYTKAHKVSGPGYQSIIDLIQVETEEIQSSGGSCAFTLYYNKGSESASLDTVETEGATTHKILNKGYRVEDFQLKGAFTAGTYCPKIRSIQIKGHYVPNN